jgi:hypothetical protein
MRHSLLYHVLLLAALAAPAAAVDVFPLTEGLLRTYESVSPGDTRTYATYFGGTTIVGGVETQVLHFAGGVDDGLQQDWTESPENDKYLHGWYRSDCDCGAEYAPPILWIDAPLALDKAWDTTVEMVGFGSVTLHFRVVAADPMTVPAGTFDSFTIEWYSDEAPPGKIAGLDFTGKRSPHVASTTPTSESYTGTAGMIRSARGSTIDTLQRVEVVAVEPRTWTGVRELYR